jgi:hypothetical protein
MSVIRRHPVITFFLLTYALSWAAIPWQSFFAPGVLVAALIVVSLTEGVAGLKAMGSRLIRWRVSWIWYALALAVPLAVTFAAIGLNTAFGAPVPKIAEFSVWYGLPMAIAINMVNPSTPSSLRRRASALGPSPNCSPPGHPSPPPY